MKKSMLTTFTAGLLLMACTSEETPLTGSWVQAVPGMPDLVQGFTLEQDGHAESIGMATLQYEQWLRDGDRLILTGKSIGNGQTISFSDTLDIVKLTEDSLWLVRGDYRIDYYRAAPSDLQSTQEESRQNNEVTDSVMTVSGRLIMGHEARSFSGENASEDFWIVDDTKHLQALYDSVVGRGAKPYTPVKATLKVVDAGPSDDGFAADYASVYRVKEIVSIEKFK